MPKRAVYPTFDAFRRALNVMAQQKFESEQKVKEQEFEYGLVSYRGEQRLGEIETAGIEQRKTEAARPVKPTPTPDTPSTMDLAVGYAEGEGKNVPFAKWPERYKRGFGWKPPTAGAGEEETEGVYGMDLNQLLTRRTSLMNALRTQVTRGPGGQILFEEEAGDVEATKRDLHLTNEAIKRGWPEFAAGSTGEQFGPSQSLMNLGQGIPAPSDTTKKGLWEKEGLR